MKILIAGAGALGFHLAQLLSTENQDITLVDTDSEVLDYAATHLDLLTVPGDASSIKVLIEAGAESANLVLAVTAIETTNLLTGMLAKKLGARNVIARVQNPEFLTKENRKFFFDLGVDYLFSPTRLAAKEIERLLNRCSFTDIFEFEKGKVSLVGITLNEHSPLANVRMENINTVQREITLRPIALLRAGRTLIARGGMELLRNDHVYFLTQPSEIDHLERFVGVERVMVKKVMIVGGSSLALETALLLEQQYKVTVVEENKDRCKQLAQLLDKSLIINGKIGNIDLLVEEGLDTMEAFLALTPNSETNIITCLTAKNRGVQKTIAQVENKAYVHISKDIGVDSLINKKLVAANNIFRFVRKGKVEAIAGMHGMDAEVIEFVVSKNNQLTRKPLRELHFPLTALVGCVVRGEELIFPRGDFQFQLNDRAIVFAMPEAMGVVERLFH